MGTLWGGLSRLRYRLRSRIGFAIALFLLSLLFSLPLASIPSPPPAVSILPAPKLHPLPPTLEAWQDSSRSGDYFDQVKTVIVDYLLWTQFPITVYIEPPTATEQANPFMANQAATWITAVQKAVQEWQPYLPLKVVNQTAAADITIRRSAPPLRLENKPVSPNQTNPASSTQANTQPNRQRRFDIPRARSAETQFELYARRSPNSQRSPTSEATPEPTTPALLAHRVTIHIRPDQAAEYLQAAARHELGHALGVWGHSPQLTDALYFSQVRNPAKISPRDLNTLKRVYQQPTRLGWPLVKAEGGREKGENGRQKTEDKSHPLMV